MRLLVLGAGGIGGYFGGRLVEAGADVTFLVRPGRAAQLARDGLRVRSAEGDIVRPVRSIGAEALAGDGPYDAVLLTCKAYDLDAAMAAIAQAVAGGAAVIPMLNGLRHLDRLDATFGADKVLGGLCAISVTLTDAGEVRHLGRMANLALGARQPSQAPLAARFGEMAAGARFTCRVSHDIIQEMWEKFVLLATLAGMTCLMRAPIGAILQADEGEALIRAMLAECDAAAAAAGHASRPDALANMTRALTERGSPFHASMLRDIARGGPTEGAHVIGDMRARAHAAGLDSPVLRVAWCHLQAYEATRQAGAAAG